MKNLLRFLPLSPLLALLAGCCANNTCNCQDLYQDALYFQFNKDASKGKVFSEVELDTVFLLRFNPITAGHNYDSIPLVKKKLRSSTLLNQLKQYKLDSSTLVLSNTYPFSPGSTGGKINNYYYKLLIKDGHLPARDTFNISQIELQGRYNADGCCTCYQNTLKRVKVNGVLHDVTETDGTPKPITLK